MQPMAADPTPAPPAGTTGAAPIPAAPSPDTDGAEAVGLVQPYQARKRYVCPGCQGIIAKGEGHLVVVPEHNPDLRRHWHRACWYRERRRRNGRTG